MNPADSAIAAMILRLTPRQGETILPPDAAAALDAKLGPDTFSRIVHRKHKTMDRATRRYIQDIAPLLWQDEAIQGIALESIRRYAELTHAEHSIAPRQPDQEGNYTDPQRVLSAQITVTTLYAFKRALLESPELSVAARIPPADAPATFSPKALLHMLGRLIGHPPPSPHDVAEDVARRLLGDTIYAVMKIAECAKSVSPMLAFLGKSSGFQGLVQAAEGVDYSTYRIR